MASQLEKLDRQKRIQEFESKGITSTAAIASALGVTERTVQRDIEEMNLAWSESERGIAFRDKWKRVLVARAEARHSWACGEWERSKEDKQRNRVQVKQAGGEDANEQMTKEEAIEGRLGDPAYLREMRENDKLIAEILLASEAAALSDAIEKAMSRPTEG